MTPLQYRSNLKIVAESSKFKATRNMKIVLLHPDLGIGGAERLVVDVAVALKQKGHSVQFVTSHYDPSHCFAETKDENIPVNVIGDWLPRCVFGKFHVACAYLRMIYAAIVLMFFSNIQPDLIFCDQISACIPILKLKKMKVIFYCHFPDLLLTQRTNWLKRLYRWPFDWLEEKTTGMADIILVNSNFTAGVFRETFRSLSHIDIEVFYPVVKFSSFMRSLNDVNLPLKINARTIFLSINRYERKKNLELAILALAKLKDLLSPKEALDVHLIIAGGYDERLPENRDYYLNLEECAKECQVRDQITFLKSPSDDEKNMLFHTCTSVLYTPQNEHFGIVPLEAMYFSRPVIACNSGGPTETVIDNETGHLCPPTPEAFAEKMKDMVRDKSSSRFLGESAAKHVRKHFSFQAFTTKLDEIINRV